MKLGTSLFAWVVMLVLQAWVVRTFPAGGCDLSLEKATVLPLHVPRENFWIQSLLLLSLLVLMPLGRGLLPVKTGIRANLTEDLSAFLAGLSLLIHPLPPWLLFEDSLGHPMPLALLLCLPWLSIRLFRVHQVLERWLIKRPSDLAGLMLDMAQFFPAIGAAWLAAHRAGWAPWSFNPLIVLLTAAHFHHAGFTLPLIAGLQARTHPSRLTGGTCLAILAGVPLVAAGITCTHFGRFPFLEPVAVTVLVLGALGVASVQLICGLRREAGQWPSLGFLISGASLIVAMLLALGFGLRSLAPELALPLPNMWQLHGSLNAFGFGLCGLLAWRARLTRHPHDKTGPSASLA